MVKAAWKKTFPRCTPIHELCHSIIEVSEEYDGAYAYTGVNTSQDLSEPVPWGAL